MGRGCSPSLISGYLLQGFPPSGILSNLILPVQVGPPVICIVEGYLWMGAGGHLTTLTPYILVSPPPKSPIPASLPPPHLSEFT